MGPHIKKDHAWFEHTLEQTPQTLLEFPTVGEATNHRVVVARAIEIPDKGSDQHRSVIVNRKEKAVGNNIDFLVEFPDQLLVPDQGLFKRP